MLISVLLYVLHLITALYISDVYIYNFILEITFYKVKNKLDNAICIIWMLPISLIRIFWTQNHKFVSHTTLTPLSAVSRSNMDNLRLAFFCIVLLGLCFCFSHYSYNNTVLSADLAQHICKSYIQPSPLTAFLGWVICFICYKTSSTAKIFFRNITAVFIAKMGIVAGHQFIIFAIRTHYNFFHFPSSSFLCNPFFDFFINKSNKFFADLVKRHSLPHIVVYCWHRYAKPFCDLFFWQIHLTPSFRLLSVIIIQHLLSFVNTL